MPLLDLMRKDARFEVLTYNFTGKNITQDFFQGAFRRRQARCGPVRFRPPRDGPGGLRRLSRRHPRSADIRRGHRRRGVGRREPLRHLPIRLDALREQEGPKAAFGEGVVVEEMNDMPEIIISGATHFDDIMHLKIPSEVFRINEYNVVLYNPPSLLDACDIRKELDEILEIVGDDRTFWFEPNGDRLSDMIMDYVGAKERKNIVFRKNWTTNRFLGYLMYCKKFIGNSSAMFYSGRGVPMREGAGRRS